MKFKKYLLLFMTTLSFAIAKDGVCWTIDDQTQTLYTFNMNTLTAPKETSIDAVNEGEGLAYRPSTHELYMWDGSNTIVRNPDTGERKRAYPTAYAHEIEGASFYIDPTTKVEELWVIVEENASNNLPRNDRYIQQVDVETGVVVAGTRKKLTGGFLDSTVDWGQDIGSLAIDPATKTFWLTHDDGTRKLANVDPLTGQITNLKSLTPLDTVDAEVLAFDDTGNMYTESDRGNTDDDPRFLWKVDPTSGVMQKATSQFGTGINGDLEGMACNSGAGVVAKDYGDAPDNYSHVSHQISDTLYLGASKPDGEDDQQSSTDATGDGADDSDGVVSLPKLTIGDTTYTVPVKVFNNTGKSAYITAWIDFDGNGIFEYEEALNTNSLEIISSNRPQTVNVVWDNTTEVNAIENAKVGKAIMRIRLTTSRVLRCDDPHYQDGNGTQSDNYLVSPDGEVEDYEITIEDVPGTPFTCNNEGIVFSADSLTSTTTNFSIVDLDKESYSFKRKFATRHINAAGYNVQDNFIYGIGFANASHSTIDVVRVDKDYNVVNMNITGLPQGNSIYALGDVDFNNRLYVSTIKSENSSSFDFVKSLIVINLKSKTVERETPLVFPVNSNMTNLRSADYAFNPKDEKLYTIDSDSNNLVRIDPISGRVELLGDVGNISDVYSVISFFDLDGNFFFTNNENTIIYRIDISNPSNINPKASVYISDLSMPSSGDGAKCAYSKVADKLFLGEFNIERTDSGNFAIGTEARNAWYTQIVGRDFDYSVLFYNKNMTKEKNINQLSLKIELINQDSNKTLYERYAYIQDATKRVDVLLPKDDLSSLPATKRAIFRVSYGVDSNNSIVQKACESDPKFCYERDTAVKKKYDYAKDNFAIRPAHFSISISDKIKLASNSGIAPRALRAAAGYEYNLTAIASQYGADSVASRGYDGVAEKVLKFNGDRTNCSDTKDYLSTTPFQSGQFVDNNFTHTNVGEYLLRLSDVTWAEVDGNKTVADCIVGESGVSANGNSLSGCNIASIADINLSFYPYQFNVNFNVNNLPSSGHDDFLYMSPVSSINDTAIQFIGSITAETQKAQRTSNFTNGCVASSVILQANTTVTTDEGVDKNVIHTSKNAVGVKEVVPISRMVKFNSEAPIFDEVSNINSPVEIDKSKFIKSQAGSVNLELRYNIKKHLSLTINPVGMLFNSLDVNSAPAYSLAEGKAMQSDPYVPTGKQDLNLTRNFYFTRVTSDMQTYPKVNFEENRVIRTPLNVDIFCDAGLQYCNNTGVRSHTDLTGLSRVQDGWYISTDHNGATDGNIQTLNPNRVQVTVTPNNDINLTKGRNGLITNTFDSCNSTDDTVMVTIVPDTPLLYDANVANAGHPYYTISCSDQNSSELSGIGQTGNVIKNKANNRKESKMDW